MEANLIRGKKWKEAKDLAIAQKRNKDAEWFDTQSSIVKDIEAYETSRAGTVDVSWSAKTKAELKTAADEAELTYEDNATKDDLIVLLENKSDEVV